MRSPCTTGLRHCSRSTARHATALWRFVPAHVSRKLVQSGFCPWPRLRYLQGNGKQMRRNSSTRKTSLGMVTSACVSMTQRQRLAIGRVCDSSSAWDAGVKFAKCVSSVRSSPAWAAGSSLRKAAEGAAGSASQMHTPSTRSWQVCFAKPRSTSTAAQPIWGSDTAKGGKWTRKQGLRLFHNSDHAAQGERPRLNRIQPDVTLLEENQAKQYMPCLNRFMSVFVLS